jgi:hypothetical protein
VHVVLLLVVIHFGAGQNSPNVGGGNDGRAPLNNIGNNAPPQVEDSDTAALMKARIQARAAKDLVKNPAAALPGSRNIYVHAVTVVPNADGAKKLGIAAQMFPETTSCEGTLPFDSSGIQALTDLIQRLF